MSYLKSSEERSALWGIIGAYLGMLLLVLVVARWMRYKHGGNDPPLVQHFLASRSINGIVMGLTLCASMFSGYTAVGIPAESYKDGFSYIRWIGSCTFISLVFCMYAPRLRWLSEHRGYVSVCEFVHDRYGITDPARSLLHWLLLLMFLVPCFVYLLAQFAAFSATLNTISDDEIPKWAAALIFAVMLAVYETVGGLRAVSLTDVVQGLVLVTGTVSIWVFANAHYGGVSEIGRRVAEVSPKHVAVMNGDAMLKSAEFWIVVGLQRSLFPDYQTRALAAASQNSLRLGTAILIIAPFFVQVPLGLLGLIGRYEYGPKEKGNKIFAKVVVDIIERDGAGRVFGSLMLAASLAAIMSTADSVLIEVSKLITCDVLKPLKRTFYGKAEEAPRDDVSIARLGHLITAILALVCVPLGTSGWNLSEMIQFQGAILAATGPTYLYGLYWPRMRGAHAMASLAWGCTMGVYAKEFGKPGHLILVIFLNFFITALAVLSSSSLGPDVDVLMMPKKATGQCEANQQVSKQASNALPPSREPMRSARIGLIISFVLAFLSLPFYFSSSAGEKLVGGYPVWALTGLLFFGAAHLVQLVIVWKGWGGTAVASDEEPFAAPFPNLSDGQRKQTGDQLKDASDVRACQVGNSIEQTAPPGPPSCDSVEEEI